MSRSRIQQYAVALVDRPATDLPPRRRPLSRAYGFRAHERRFLFIASTLFACAPSTSDTGTHSATEPSERTTGDATDSDSSTGVEAMTSEVEITTGTTGGVGTGSSSTHDPSSADPSSADPSTTDPSTTDLSTGDPSTTDPSTGDPSTGDPSTTDPSSGDPSSGGDAPGLFCISVREDLLATICRVCEPVHDDSGQVIAEDCCWAASGALDTCLDTCAETECAAGFQCAKANGAAPIWVCLPE